MSIAIREAVRTIRTVEAGDQRMSRLQADTSNAIATGGRGPSLADFSRTAIQTGFAKTWLPYWVQATRYDMDFFKELRPLSGNSK